LRRTIVVLALAMSLPAAGQQCAKDDKKCELDHAPIQDNSFLVEEAYNQEHGIVQHISTFTRMWNCEDWTYSFTQEWPFRGIRNQLSYTVPVLHRGGAGTGLGDIALNYRYQLLGGEGALHAAPRLTVLLPTGSERRGRGAGALGLQTNCR
jgi:hypothetical protein